MSTQDDINLGIQNYYSRWDAGECYHALKEVRGLFEATNSMTEDRLAIIKKLALVEMKPSCLNQIRQGLQSEIEKSEKIMSFGDHFDSDEALLVLTNREWLNICVMMLFDIFGLIESLDTRKLDEDIQAKFRRLHLPKKARQLFHKIFFEQSMLQSLRKT